MSCGMAGGIDIHTHMVPADIPAYAGASGGAAWPSIKHKCSGHAHIMIAGKLFRTVTTTAWDVPRRLADLDAMGLARQVVSPMPELLSYWLDIDDAVQLLRHVNGTIAAMAAEAPERIIGMGAVPLQDVDRAIAELRHNADALGLRAVEVGSNINGIAIGDPRFEPFFEAAANLDIAVFVHALRAAGRERLVGPPLLEQIVAFPGEIGLAAASLITSGILTRHSGLRIAFSHGGGALGLMLARMEHFWTTLPKFKELLIESPLETARRAYFDLTVFDPAVVAFLREQFGTGRLLVGSDYPFGAYEDAPHKLLSAAGFDAAERDAVTSRNALAYLGLTDQEEAQ